VRALMVAAGLDDSVTALQHGLDIVVGRVVDGKRIVTAKDVNEAVDERGPRRVDPSAISSSRPSTPTRTPTKPPSR
jgi:hypothetical protein